MRLPDTVNYCRAVGPVYETVPSIEAKCFYFEGMFTAP